MFLLGHYLARRRISLCWYRYYTTCTNVCYARRILLLLLHHFFMIYEGLHPQVRKQDMFALKESFLVCINGTLLKMDTFALRYTV